MGIENNMSTYIDASTTTREHCESMSALHPDLSLKYDKISTLYTSKLWHQLTICILEFVSTPESTLRCTHEGGNSYLAIFDKILLPIDKKLNPLSLARIGSAVASSLLVVPAVPGTTGGDGVAARAVLENLLEKKFDLLGPAAVLYTESKLALLQLTLSQQDNKDNNKNNNDEMNQIKDMIKSGSKMLEHELEGADTIVHSAFYESSMTYRKIVGPPEAFYQQAMLYLNYTPLEQMTKEDKYHLATGISLAALTGDGVFNFGEVLEHPILISSLKDTENQWLLDLMHVFGNGNVTDFRSITAQHDVHIRAQPALVSRADVVQEKITLLALVNMVFERPSAERTLEFSDIADRICVSVEQVEWVVMRALSLGLIKGSMDQVDGTVTVTWVMPRVLNSKQLEALAERFGQWAVKVSKTREYMGEQIPSLA